MSDEEASGDEAAFRAKLAIIARAQREAAGLSPGQAAKRAQISRAAVRDVEGPDKGWPRLDTLVAYARAVGTTPWSMIQSAQPATSGSSEPGPGEDELGAGTFEPPPVDLNALLRDASATPQVWKTAEALLRALVGASASAEGSNES